MAIQVCFRHCLLTLSCTGTGMGPVWLETSSRCGIAVDIPVQIYTWPRVVLGLFLKFNWSSRTKFINLQKLLLLQRSRIYSLYCLLRRPCINSVQEMYLWLGEVQAPYVESEATDTLKNLCSFLFWNAIFSCLEVLVGERLATFQEHLFLTPESRFWAHLLIFIKGIWD